MKVRVRAAEQPRTGLLPIVATALALLVAAATLGSGTVRAQEAEAPVESPAAVESPGMEGVAEEPGGGIDGTWTIDNELGSFEQFNNSWVGFRVNEVLSPGGEVQAIGRTPVVSGELTVNGTVIESARIEADLTAIVSDRSRRDPAIQEALGTSEFPTAVFESSGPVDLGMIPAINEEFAAAIPGAITISDMTRDVDLDLAAVRAGEAGDIVLVVGTLPVDFTSFGVTMPTAPIVVSVEDRGDLEWNLWFRQGISGPEAGAAEEPEAEATAEPET